MTKVCLLEAGAHTQILLCQAGPADSALPHLRWADLELPRAGLPLNVRRGAEAPSPLTCLS